LAREPLKRSGALTIWFDPALACVAAPPVRRGRPRDDGDAEIRSCLGMRLPFGMTLCQIEPWESHRFGEHGTAGSSTASCA
jgi:hypothetical protein